MMYETPGMLMCKRQKLKQPGRVETLIAASSPYPCMSRRHSADRQCCGSRLASQALNSFEKGAAEMEVGGTDWNCTDAYSALQQDIVAHVRGLEVQKVRVAWASVIRGNHSRSVYLVAADSCRAAISYTPEVM